MNCAQALISLFLLAPCGDGGSEPSAAIQQAVARTDRPAADVQRDKHRKPAAVLSFLSIEPGMTVLDVFAGGGYYTELLDSIVGPGGHVLSHNNQAYISYVGDELQSRFDANRLPHTERIIAEADDLELTDHSLDAVLMVLVWHDFFYGSEEDHWPDADESAFIGKLCHAMKPGAVLGLVDHIANPGGDISKVAETLHRIDPQRVKAQFAGTCFEFDGESDVLRNPEDDHTLVMSDPSIRGRTDRFLFRFVRKKG